MVFAIVMMRAAALPARRGALAGEPVVLLGLPRAACRFCVPGGAGAWSTAGYHRFAKLGVPSSPRWEWARGRGGRGAGHQPEIV